MKKIGHHPGAAETVEGWSFRRCRCGFVLALSQSGRVYWIRAGNTVAEIASLADLLYALSTDCRHYRRPERAAPAATGRQDSAEQKPAAPAESLQATQIAARAAVAAKPVVVVRPRRRPRGAGG